MTISPAFSQFQSAYDAGKNSVIYTKLSADLDTPVALMLKLTQARKNAFMLESVTGGDQRGRYSVIGMNPDIIWTCKGTQSFSNTNALHETGLGNKDTLDALSALRNLLADSQIDLPNDLPPMSAGLFGYLGYDMIRLVEKLPDQNPDHLELPDALMLRPTIIAILDGVKDELILISPIWHKATQSAKDAYQQGVARIQAARRDMAGTSPQQGASKDTTPIGKAQSNTTQSEYFAMVERAKDYIRAGDIFQVVPSQRWAMDFALPPFALYRALRRTNPSPYMFYFNFGDFQIIGASPEILVQVSDKQVTIRPIAGTRPRGKDQAQDQAYERDLLSDEKELAEHLMLLDLGRNDVGRVAKTGSVRPSEQFIIERYSHVMHIVSNVQGTLSDDHDALSALLAGLPAGTVSGAPKLRAMEIIDELEVEKRGVYGGGVGYFSSNGDMDICIALRTGVIKDETLYVQAGGGVVYDSEPKAEYQETINKSNALMKAAEIANQFTDPWQN